LASPTRGQAVDLSSEVDLKELDQGKVFLRIRDVSAGQWSYPYPGDQIVIPPNGAAELLNIEIDRVGQRVKRRGYTARCDDLGDSPIDGLIGFSPSGSARLLLLETAGTIYSWDGSAGTCPSRQAGLTDATDWTEFVLGGARVFRLSESDNVRSSTDGLTWIDEGNTNTDFPRVSLAIWTSNQRMLACNSLADPNGCYYSNSGDPQTYDRTTNLFLFGPVNADGVTGIIEFTDTQVIVFNKQEMFIWDISNATPSSWTRAKVADIGSEAPRTLRLIGEDALFLSRDGVRSVVQSAQDKKRGASLPLSFPIQDWIDRINWAQVDQAVAWVWDDSYWLSVPIDSATTNSHVLVWSRRAFEANERRGGWTVFDTITANSYAVQNFGTDPRFYFGNAAADSRLYEVRSADPTDDALTDNTAAIIYRETSKRYDFGLPELDKTFSTFEVEALAESSGSIEVEAQVDGEGWTAVGTLALTTGAPTLPENLPFSLVPTATRRGKFDLQRVGRGRNIQYRLTEETSGAETEILNVVIAASLEPFETE
jgi:hypothetical protein